MKRGAEKQLVKGRHSSDEETEEGPIEFTKADESTLATRKIRGLPKRASAAATVNGTSTSEPESLATTPKFSGFAGFGPANSNGSFTFTTSAAKPTSIASQVTSVPSGTPSTVSATASTTAKTLASFLGAPPDVSAAQKLTSADPATNLAFPLVESSPPTIAPPMSLLTATESGGTANDSAVRYYSNLRGLNVSFVSALSRAMSEDPFLDFSQLLEQYKGKRSSIQSDYDTAKKSCSNDATKPDETKPKAPSMPTPPTSFSFGKSTNAPSLKIGASSNAGGFKPSFSPSSPFKFSSTTSTPFSEPPATLNGAAGKSETGNKPVAFGNSTFSMTSTSSAGNLPKSDIHNPFKLPSSSAGGSNIFGHSPTSNSSVGPDTTSSGAFSAFAKPSGSGSIGNPVGFGFGVNAGDSKESSISAEAKPTPASGFTFGRPSTSVFGSPVPKESKETGGEESGEGGSEDASATTEGDEAAKAGLSDPSQHDAEGEGEEEEETTHSVRLKAYRMKKADEKGGQGWVEIGVGYLRLKRHKETNARRMLLRNSSTGKININFTLYGGFKVTRAKKSLTFVGHDGAVAQTYNVRLPNEDQVGELKEAIEREVALIQSQDG